MGYGTRGILCGEDEYNAQCGLIRSQRCGATRCAWQMRLVSNIFVVQSDSNIWPSQSCWQTLPVCMRLPRSCWPETYQDRIHRLTDILAAWMQQSLRAAMRIPSFVCGMTTSGRAGACRSMKSMLVDILNAVGITLMKHTTRSG